MSRPAYYPDDISDWAICQMEGCIGKGSCPRCGEVNYQLMGYYGAVARWAKRWSVTEDAAAKLISEHQEQAAIKAGVICADCKYPVGDDFCCLEVNGRFLTPRDKAILTWLWRHPRDGIKKLSAAVGLS